MFKGSFTHQNQIKHKIVQIRKTLEKSFLFKRKARPKLTRAKTGTEGKPLNFQTPRSMDFTTSY